MRDADRAGDRLVLMLIGGGIVAIILAIIATVAFKGDKLHEIAEPVFSAIIGGAIVKLADVLSALGARSGSRQLERATDQLGAAHPAGPIDARIVNPPGDPVPVEER